MGELGLPVGVLGAQWAPTLSRHSDSLRTRLLVSLRRRHSTTARSHSDCRVTMKKRERARERARERVRSLRVVWRARVPPHSLRQILWCADSSLMEPCRHDMGCGADCVHTDTVGAELPDGQRSGPISRRSRTRSWMCQCRRSWKTRPRFIPKEHISEAEVRRGFRRARSPDSAGDCSSPARVHFRAHC